jgi:hypothetical protein
LYQENSRFDPGTAVSYQGIALQIAEKLINAGIPVEERPFRAA